LPRALKTGERLSAALTDGLSIMMICLTEDPYRACLPIRRFR
jgi:hypothetical protein